MDTVNIILLAVGIINLVMSLFIISRGWRSKINLYFSLLIFSTALWSFSLFFARYFWSLPLTKFFEDGTSIIGIFIAIFLFYFCQYFPYKERKVAIFEKSIIFIIPIFLFYFILSGQYSKEFIIRATFGDYFVNYQTWQFILYTVYFILLCFWGMRSLINKYRKSEGTIKEQLSSVLLTLIIGLSLAILCSVLLVDFGIFTYNWLGPVFSLLINSAVFYLIFFKNKSLK